jgi:hypothetical protein
MSIEWLTQNSGTNDGENKPGVFFQGVGAKIVGTIDRVQEGVDTKFGPRIVIELTAAEGTTANKGSWGADGPIAAGDEVVIWLGPGAMAAAFRDAIGEAKVPGLAVGDTIALACSEEVDTGKPSKLKKYVARYTPATPAVNLESLV